MAKGRWLKVFENWLKAEGAFSITKEITMPLCSLPVALRLLPFTACPLPFASRPAGS